MLRALFVFGFILVNTTYAYADAVCRVAGISEKNVPFSRELLLKGPGEISSEIFVFPDGSVSADPESSLNYVKKHRIPGKVYDDSENGIKNSLALLHGTYIFTVYSDEEGNELVNLSISKLNSRAPIEEGATQIATTVDQTGTRLSLNAHPKIFRGGSLVKLTFDCSIK
jgi:hypothetical protein